MTEVLKAISIGLMSRGNDLVSFVSRRLRPLSADGYFDGRKGSSVGAIDEREAGLGLGWSDDTDDTNRSPSDTRTIRWMAKMARSRTFEVSLICRPNVHCQNGGLCGVILGRWDGPPHVV